MFCNYRKSSVVAGYHIFAPASLFEKYMEGAIFRFHGTKKDGCCKLCSSHLLQIMAATKLFGNINIHLFEDGNGKMCRFILAHVLMQTKCCLFPVILSSFHRRGRRNYI